MGPVAAACISSSSKQPSSTHRRPPLLPRCWRRCPASSHSSRAARSHPAPSLVTQSGSPGPGWAPGSDPCAPRTRYQRTAHAAARCGSSRLRVNNRHPSESAGSTTGTGVSQRGQQQALECVSRGSPGDSSIDFITLWHWSVSVGACLVPHPPSPHRGTGVSQQGRLSAASRHPRPLAPSFTHHHSNHI